MSTDETPSLEQNPDEQEQNLDLETTPEGDDSKGDPLDKIEDPEALRGEAKKYRSIAARKADRPAATVVEKKADETPAVAEAPSDFVKKSDLELVNQKKAIRLATTASETDSDEVKALKADMLENWDHVRSFYTPRRGKDTPEDVFEDIKDAYVLFSTRRPNKEGKPDLSFLTASVIKQGSGQAPAAKPTTKVEQPPNFALPTPPSEWYPKKQG